MGAYVKEDKKPVGLFSVFHMLGLPVTEAEESLTACGQNPLRILNRQFYLCILTFHFLVLIVEGDGSRITVF